MTQDFEVKELPARAVVTVRKETTPPELGDAYGELLPRAASHAKEAGAVMVGPPFGIYHSFSEERVDLEAGAPVAEVVEDGQGVRSYELPAWRAASTMHVGPYETIGQAHEALHRWAQEQGHEVTGPAMEIYWTDPAEEPDASTWRTEVLLGVG